MGASYASMARTMLSKICSGRATEVHVCFDKYVKNSIKDSERKLRGAFDSVYIITGPDQTLRQAGAKLITNGIFKNEFAKFLMREWEKDHNWNLFEWKTLYASQGGECYQYVPQDDHSVEKSKPPHLQGNHEEADTLIACHAASIGPGSIMVRASDIV